MINELTDEGSGVRGRAATSIICWSGSGVLHDDMSEASFVQFVPSLNRGHAAPQRGGRAAGRASFHGLRGGQVGAVSGRGCPLANPGGCLPGSDRVFRIPRAADGNKRGLLCRT